MNWKHPKRLTAIVVPFIAAVAFACGGITASTPAPTSVSTSADTPVAAQVASEPQVTKTSLEPVGDTRTDTPPRSTNQLSGDLTSRDSQAVDATIAGLDPDQVVAAYETVLNRVYENLLPSVVHIRVSSEVTGQSGGSFGLPPLPGGGGDDGPGFFRQGEGSGFVWDDDGHIVTNQHVVADTDRVTVIFSDGTALEAEVLGGDPDSDLAVLKVEIPPGLVVKPVVPGESGEVKVGQLAIAIGNPFGQEFTVTSGIVSAVGRTISSGLSQFSIPEVVQTDAPINPGNSGGPLLNRKGEVIGINTQIISRSGSSSGIGFAVPIDVAKQVIPALIENGEFQYAWLGIRGTTLTRDIAELMNVPEGTRGALVINTAEGGPAEKGGLKGSDRTQRTDDGNAPLGGDTIVSVDGSPIRDMDDLITYLVAHTRPGDIVTLGVFRDGGESADIQVTLGTRP